MVPQLNCESTPIWRKSSASGGSGGCVEVATASSFVLVRDSGNRSGAALAFPSEQWRGLVHRIQNGQVALR
jgi:hypothetical protein